MPVLHPLQVLFRLRGFLAVRIARKKILECGFRVLRRVWIVGAGSGSFRPNVTDLILSIDRDRVVGKLFHHGLVSGNGRLILSLLLAGPPEIELRPGRVFPVGGGLNDQREDLGRSRGSGLTVITPRNFIFCDVR